MNIKDNNARARFLRVLLLTLRNWACWGRKEQLRNTIFEHFSILLAVIPMLLLFSFQGRYCCFRLLEDCYALLTFTVAMFLLFFCWHRHRLSSMFYHWNAKSLFDLKLLILITLKESRIRGRFPQRWLQLKADSLDFGL